MNKNMSNLILLGIFVSLLAPSLAHTELLEVDLCTDPGLDQPIPQGAVLIDQWRPIGILFDADPPSVSPIMMVWGSCHLFFSPDVYGVNAVFSFVDPGTDIPINATRFKLNGWYSKDESAQLIGLDSSGAIVAQDQITPGDIGEDSKTLGMTIIGQFQTVEWRTQGNPGIAANGIWFELEPDSDGDGLYDSWERDGIDANNDGTVDLDLPTLGAQPDHKDIFVEVDMASGQNFPVLSQQILRQAFINAPVTNPDGRIGINLHILPDENTLNVSRKIQFNAIDWAPEFDSLKSSHFGTQTDQNHANKEHILEAKKRAFRYCIFARDSADGTSGRGETPGNDFFLTLDALSAVDYIVTAHVFMHELGHTFGLNHGGRRDDIINYKPNYVSVMNWALMNPNMYGQYFLDYSRYSLEPLNENNLNEHLGVRSGLTVPPREYVGISMPYGYWVSRDNRGIKFANLLGGPVDWDQDGEFEFNISADLNHLPSSYPRHNTPSPGQILEGHNDWENLVYNFRNTATYGAGIHGNHIHPEITQEILDWMEENMKVPKRFPWTMFLPAMTRGDKN